MLEGRPPFKFAASTRVGFSDTDAQGVVYYLEGEQLAVTATQTLVLVDLTDRRPCPVSEWWREKIRAFESGDVEA